MKDPALFAIAALSLLACGKGAPPGASAPPPGPPLALADLMGDWTSETGAKLTLRGGPTDAGPFVAEYHDGADDDPKATWSTDGATHRSLAVTLSLDRRVCGRWTDKSTLRITRVLPAANHHCPTDPSVYDRLLSKPSATTAP